MIEHDPFADTDSGQVMSRMGLFTGRGRRVGIGSAFAQIVTPGALERLAGFVAEIWSLRSEHAYLDDEVYEVEVTSKLPQDPIEELDQAEIIQIIRREHDGFSSIGVDSRGLEPDTTLALMLRATIQLLLEELIEFEDDEAGEGDAD